MKLTTEDVSAFFAHKGATEVCPFCGQVEWFYNENMELSLPAVASDILRQAEPSGSPVTGEMAMHGVLTSVIIMCRTCGFIRLHSRRLIEDWVGKQRSGQNDNNK